MGKECSLLFIGIVTLWIVGACGSRTIAPGKIGIQLRWASRVPSVSVQTLSGRFHPQTLPDEVREINVQVLGDFGEILRSFSPDDHPDGARIDDVPAGSGVKVRVEARLRASGEVLYSGTAVEVEVVAGEETPVTVLLTPEGVFSPLEGMNTPRAFAAVSGFQDSVVIISGGVESCEPEGDRWRISPTDTLEIFSPSDGSFQLEEGALDTSRFFHTATVRDDRLVFLVGGIRQGWMYPDLTFQAGIACDSVEVFNRESGLMEDYGRLRQARYLHTADALPDGRILLTGGWDGEGGRISRAEILNPENGEIQEVEMLTGRAAHRSLRLASGAIVFWGGER